MQCPANPNTKLVNLIEVLFALANASKDKLIPHACCVHSKRRRRETQAQISAFLAC